MNCKKEWTNFIRNHYEQNWTTDEKVKHWSRGPIQDLPVDFCILEFKPTKTRELWTYATCGMSQPEDEVKVELHLFSKTKDEGLVELLTAITHYHRTSSVLNLNHSVNFGRPWLPNSKCEYGFISLPYLDGPSLEWFSISDEIKIRFLWLIPVMKEEIEFKKQNGIEALENAFEKANFDYANPMRLSVIRNN